MENKIYVLGGSTHKETENRNEFLSSLKNSPIPDSEILQNLGLFINRQLLSRILFINEIYQKIVNIHGVIMEFGVRWGQNLSLYSSLRGIYEPYNYNRKIIGFDTFNGFPEIMDTDGSLIKKGDYSVTSGYDDYLTKLLNYHQSESPIPHKKKYELVKGDATETIFDYLKRHPETIVALAYFDFDIYKPTKVCLDAIKDRLSKGSILVFDEVNCPEFPGETIALLETFKLSDYSLQRSPLNPLISYIVI